MDLDRLEVTSERLVLRVPGAGDIAGRVEALQEESMRRFLPDPDPYTVEHAWRFVAADRDTGRVVGSGVLLLPQPRQPGVEISGSVYRDARGNGYAAEMTRALTGVAFEHGVRRVELVIDVADVPSLHVALRAGFRYEGVQRGRIRRVRHGYADAAVFARTPQDGGASIAPRLPLLSGAGLSDGVVGLRAVTAEDADVLYDEASDDLSRQWAMNSDEPAREHFVARASHAAVDWLAGPACRMVITDLESGRAAGTMMIMFAGPPQVGLVGYGLLPVFRGRGYTARALRLLAPWTFAHGVARLELGAAAANRASQIAAQRGGFEPDGIRHGRLRTPSGSFSDEVCFALVNPATGTQRPRPARRTSRPAG